MRKFLIAALLLMLVFALLFCLWKHIPLISANCAERSQKTLQEEGLGFLNASVASLTRDVTIAGTAPDEASKQRAIDLLRAQSCVHTVVDNVGVAPPLPATVSPYVTTIAKDESNVFTLTGFVPDESGREWLVNGAGAAGASKVVDELELATGASTHWTDAMTELLGQSADFDHFSATLRNDALSLDGSVASNEARAALEESFEQFLPESITRTLNIVAPEPEQAPASAPESAPDAATETTPAPAVATIEPGSALQDSASQAADVAAVFRGPYETTYTFDDTGARLSGYVDNDGTRAWLLDSADRRFGAPRVNADIKIRTDAPAGWRNALGAVVDHGSDYSKMTATVRSDQIDINAVATSAAHRARQQALISGALPADVSVSFKVSTPDDPATYVALEPTDVDCQIRINGYLGGETGLFAFDSADLSNDASQVIMQIAKALETCPSADVIVAGHTDASGNDDYNLRLSRRRADAVATALAKQGVSGERIRAVGFGEQLSKGAKNDREAGSRRVEIVVTRR